MSMCFQVIRTKFSSINLIMDCGAMKYQRFHFQLIVEENVSNYEKLVEGK